jgi:hypothetical protein
VPHKCPVIRVAYPQWRRSRLMAQLGMPLTFRVLARLHISLSHATHTKSQSFTRIAADSLE